MIFEDVSFFLVVIQIIVWVGVFIAFLSDEYDDKRRFFRHLTPLWWIWGLFVEFPRYVKKQWNKME